MATDSGLPRELLIDLGLKGIADVHVHPLPILSEEELLEAVRGALVERCILLALDVEPEELEDEEKARSFVEEMLNAGIWDVKALDVAKELLRRARTPNERVAELVRRHPDLFLGFGSVNPSKPMSYVIGKLREIEDLGLSGIKLIPTLQFFCPSKAKKALRKVLKFCERAGMLVMFHTGCDPGPWEAPALSKCARPSLLAPFVRSFSKVRFILAHSGSYSARAPGIWFDEALELARKHENVWLDVAAVPYLLTEPSFARALRGAGLMDRVLFGSDFPVIGV
ncbi:hypothetical protein DRO60_03465, partial [Candidatus Bathyarchaeota archaeon]